MCNNDIERTRDMNTFNNIDWCHEIYLDICHGIESLHEKLGESQVSYTILGCSIIHALFYLDWLHHREGPVNRLTIPRISVFTNEMITKLIAADVIRDSHTIVGYGA